MSSAYNWESAISQYEDQLNAYHEKVDLLKRAAEGETESLRTLIGETAGPVAMHYVEKGLENVTGRVKNAVGKITSAAKDKVEGALDDAKTRIQGMTDEARSRISGTADDVQALVDEGSSTVQEVSSSARGSLRNLERFGSRAYGEGSTSFSRSPLDQLDSISNPRSTTELSEVEFKNPLFDPDQFNLPSVEGNVGLGDDPFAPLSMSEFQDNAWDFGSNHDYTYHFGDDMTGSQMQSMQTQVMVSDEDSVPSSSVNTSQARDVQAEQDVGKAWQQSESEIERVTGLDQMTTTEAIETGASEEVGGKLLGGTGEESVAAFDAGEGISTAAAAEAGTDEAAEIAAETGAATEGLGDILAGVIALGGLLGGIFGAKEEPKPVQIPNVSIPGLQRGLA